MPMNPNDLSLQASDYAQALHDFIERLLLKDVVLVGNSLGCLMATAYAAAHPERVRSAIFGGLGANMVRPMAGTGPIARALEAASIDEVTMHGMH